MYRNAKAGRKSSWYPSGARYRYGSFGFFPSKTCSSACPDYFWEGPRAFSDTETPTLHLEYPASRSVLVVFSNIHNA